MAGAGYIAASKQIPLTEVKYGVEAIFILYTYLLRWKSSFCFYYIKPPNFFSMLFMLYVIYYIYTHVNEEFSNQRHLICGLVFKIFAFGSYAMCMQAWFFSSFCYFSSNILRKKQKS